MVNADQQIELADQLINGLLKSGKAIKPEDAAHLLQILMVRCGVWIAHNVNDDAAMEAGYTSYIHHYNNLNPNAQLGQQEAISA